MKLYDWCTLASTYTHTHSDDPASVCALNRPVEMTFVHIWKVWNTIPTAKGNIWEPVLAQPKEPDHSSVPSLVPY